MGALTLAEIAIVSIVSETSSVSLPRGLRRYNHRKARVVA